MAEILWKKSSYSGADDNQDCVEVATRSGAVLIRESDAPDLVIAAAPRSAHALLVAVKDGRLRKAPVS
ncbi:hypothetical protein FHS39_001934 [Streptomyces olivoverticillatus]|uniref:DUF397 domain-containing protein n=1 Tax=Streptomyces olivoverticillatus TaxID=66427 RepID=A0A7W7PKZ5_9ACTN|nr:DUF397 domain-containing protein [Streptomyces olivoverticillatus]MBB4892923.1 hypothetical protein [Streptomyces olivoverticillatus]